ncbi:MAG: EAL domain-containing protein, partial [Thermomicrobiales bacterium]|nr:EAL domain-containing protein [Thermomicrobiales bacterium]
IVLANPAAERILGLSSAQLEGRTARDSVWHASLEDGTPVSPELHPSSITLRTGLPQTDIVMSVTIGEGEPVWVSVTTRPVRLPESDAPNGVVASFFDITERKRLEMTVREGDERLRSILDLTGVGTWTLDVQTGEVVWSEQLRRIFAVAPDAELTFDSIMTLMHPDDRVTAVELMSRALAEGGDYDLENRALRPDGTIGWVAGRGRAIPGTDGRPARMVGIGYDITERKNAEEALRASEARFRQLLEAAPDGIVIVDDAGVISHANPRMEHLFGYAPGQLRGRSIDILIPERDRGAHAAHRATFSVAPRLRSMGDGMELRGCRSDGTEFPVEVSLSPLVADDGRFVIAVVRDVTARKQLQDQLTVQATRDALTGLPNRASFLRQVEQALGRRHSVALLFLDLDGFKLVNDTLGHDAGDRLLIDVARRLAACIRQGDIAARLGGDEFTVLLDGADLEDATTVADRILAAFREPIVIGGHPRHIGASIGVAVSRRGGTTANTLLQQADVALYDAKAAGKAQVAVFAPEMGARVRRRVQMEAGLRGAIAADALRLVFQPQVDLTTGELVGLEALVRWAHPTRGLVPPAEFIPLAEETGLIVPLGEWVLRNACRQLRHWREAHPSARHLFVGVNLAGRQLRLPDLANRILSILSAEGLAPADIELELTERLVVEELEAGATALSTLASLGMRLAIDDFGTGYSALGHLRHLAFGTLKIDRSFIAGLERDPKSAAIVEAVTTLAGKLGLRVTAEGIETPEELLHARFAGCTRGQGYLFLPPTPGDQIGDLLATGASFDILSNIAPVPSTLRSAG